MQASQAARALRKRLFPSLLLWTKLVPILFFAYLSLSLYFLLQNFGVNDARNVSDKEQLDNLQKELEKTKAALSAYERQGGNYLALQNSPTTRHVAPSPGSSLPPLTIVYPTFAGELLEDRSTPTVLDDAYDPKHPLFTIVVAAYNQGKFLEETVQSVVNQSYVRWEMIIVDDGSKDDTLQRALALLTTHEERQIRVVRKPNGGLADARNTGLKVARGSWLCMLDSDDLLAGDYLKRVAELAVADRDIMIVPGCMRNFDAVSSDWCFPEGFSVVGIAHWNKFHASVLINRELMARVGGYDPSIPWGLEDWNFWLHAARYNPKVAFVPELTFWYRHHAGSSMRKKMFSAYLEETKAMVRVNHPWLYEPQQLLFDHERIADMSYDTLVRIEEKIFNFPDAPGPFFWRALVRSERNETTGALNDLRSALARDEKGSNPRLAWQIHYRLALVYERMGRLLEAHEEIERAMEWSYCDAILQAKRRLERAISADLDRFGPLPAGKVLVNMEPIYWQEARMQEATRDGTLAGKLVRLARIEESLPATLGDRGKMLAILRLAEMEPCSPKSAFPGKLNEVNNPHFAGGMTGWSPYGQGFTYDGRVGRFRGGGGGTSVKMENRNDGESRATSQVVKLNQESAAPLVVSGWSKAREVSGSPDSGYSLYLDILFDDDTHEWGYHLPFKTGAHTWQRVIGFLDRPKPVRQIELYCMFRGHSGIVWFDDIAIAVAKRVICQSSPGLYYEPSEGTDMEQCPSNNVCTMGFKFESFDAS